MDVLINWLPFIGAIAVVVLGYLFGKRKDSADISANLAKASDTLSELYEKRIKALEDNIAAQDKELKILRSLPDHVARLERIIIAYQEGTEKLLKQFKKHKIEPEWEPSPFLLEEVKR
jgi:uncharacterized coiled-coil protein SlyX